MFGYFITMFNGVTA